MCVYGSLKKGGNSVALCNEIGIRRISYEAESTNFAVDAP